MFNKICSIIFVVFFIFPMNCYAGEISAQSAVVIDGETGEILYEKSKDSPLPMASTTKIMTAFLACESGKLDETVIITDEMADTQGNRMGIREKDKISLNDLVVGMMLTSGNDAANAVAIFLGGSVENFAVMMNSTAFQLGMTSSVFVTPSGLDEGNHHSTAFDMAILAKTALGNEKFAEICKLKKAEIKINKKTITVYNHNKLLSFLDDCIGLKTGYTEKSGRCLVSAVKRNGKLMICTTLNAPNDWDDHINLFKICEKKYKQVKVCNTIYLSVVGARENSFSGYYCSDLTVLDESKLSVKLFYFKINYAPIKKGEIVGCAVYYYDNKEIKKLKIKSKEDIEYLRTENG